MKKGVAFLACFLLILLLNPYINFTAESSGKDSRVYLKREGNHWTKVVKGNGDLRISEVEGFLNPEAGEELDEPFAGQTSSLFLLYQDYPVGSWPEAVAIGDVNGDGLNDVVMTTSFGFDTDNDYKIFVFLQNVSGGLDTPVKYDAGDGDSIDIGDLNNDGRDDVVVTNTNAIGVFIQNIAGTLDAMTSYSATNDTHKVRIGDFNNDGLADVASIAWGNQTNGYEVNVFLQNVSGTLNTPVIYNVVHEGYDDLEVGDINNDGLTDIVVMSGQSSSNQIGVLYQNSGGSFDAAVYYNLGASELTHGVAVGDVNGDSLNDVVVTYGGNQPSSFIGVFLQNISGTLGSPISYESYDIPEPVIIADIDCDSRQDVATAHGGWVELGVYLQEDDGTFVIEELYNIPYASHYNPHGLAVGDINNDTGNDVVIADYSSGLVVLYGTRKSEYKLTIAAEAGGTTEPVPGTHIYNNGTEVTLTATPDEGYRFTHWSGSVMEAENPLTITMDSDKSITANFTLQRVLTIETSAGGRTTPSEGTHLIDYGTYVTITAVPFTDYRFSGWSGDASGEANPIVITMDADKSITASFIRQYALSISASTGGTTDPSPGAYTYDIGTQVTIRATAESGYQFSGWSGDASGTQNPITLTMDSAAAIRANFSSTGQSGGDEGDSTGEEDSGKKKCFIATATYGSSLHPYVDTLRHFRDAYLMPNRIGRILVYLYYRYSPLAADLIATNRTLRAASRIILLPIVAFSYSILQIGPKNTAFLLLLIFSLPVLIISLYRSRRGTFPKAPPFTY